MLGQIANYCPIISRNTLVKNSTSPEFIWQTIRQHFGFQVTGVQFIDFSAIHLAADERPEDLYQRLTAFVEDSLLRANGLTHNGQAVQEDEELTPTLENFLVLTWLRLIHPSLPRLALNSLLEEIHTSDDARILRAAVADDFRRPRQSNRGVPRARPRQPRQDKVCPLCKQAGRSMTNHFLSQCTFLPDSDRRFMVKARQIAGILDNDQEIETSPDSDSPDPDTTLPGPDMVAYRVQTRQSPYMDVFHDHRVVRVTLDSGATGNMIRRSTAKHLGCPIISSAQSVQQADGSSQLQVIGEILWPGEFMEVRLPGDAPSDSECALEPRIDAPSAHNLKPSQLWPQPGVVSSVARAIQFLTYQAYPALSKRHEHFCQVIPVFEPPSPIITPTYCSAPVAALQSFIGAYKVLSRVIPRCSSYLTPLDAITAGRTSQESITWSDNFASRNAAPCENETCQICLFIASTRDSVVRAATVQDILQGNARLPFTSRPAWLAIQSECPDLRCPHARTPCPRHKTFQEAHKHKGRQTLSAGRLNRK
ncbi:unnamed protein product [Pocillopora meandrina]|uniref:Uncharacterized protein n=1 Tax=Pocillopora meandrina TaxID=46732 RepID=A0AAU9VMR3_9CNID|nr:unnamed protein product [Pocillopora meandrina]